MSSSSTSVKQFNLPILREAVDYPRWEQAVKGALFERGWESILQPLVSKQEEYKQTEYDSDAAAARAMASTSNELAGSTQLTPDQQRALVIDQLGASAAAEAKQPVQVDRTKLTDRQTEMEGEERRGRGRKRRG